MNTITKEEVTALNVTERAAIALRSGTLARELVELAESTKDIVTITNKDGRAQCHAAYMVAKNKRIEIEKLGKAARDDANNFSKACVAEEKRLTSLIEPEEARLQALRDAFDAKEKAEKEAREAAERQRIQNIKDRIVGFTDLSISVIKVGVSVDEAKAVLDMVTAIEIDDSFGEFRGEALEARSMAIKQVNEAIAMKEAAAAESARLEAERVRLEEQRAEIEKQKAELEAMRAASAPVVVAPQAEAEEPPAQQESQPVPMAQPVERIEAAPIAAVETVTPSEAVIIAEPVIAFYLNARAGDLPQRQRDFLRAHLVEFVKTQREFSEQQIKTAA